MEEAVPFVKNYEEQKIEYFTKYINNEKSN